MTDNSPATDELAQEFSRLVEEYRSDTDSAIGAEAWNLIADFSVSNFDAIYSALNTRIRAETAKNSGEVVAPELRSRFIRFVNTIESRAMASDGPVSPFLEELNDASGGEKEQFVGILRDLYASF